MYADSNARILAVISNYNERSGLDYMEKLTTFLFKFNKLINNKQHFLLHI